MTDPAPAVPLPAPPDPPRAVTPRVRRRAWADPHVRFWWLVAAALLAAGGWLGASGFGRWRHERELMAVPPVPATIRQTSVETVQNRPVKRGTPMQLEFPFRGRTASAWAVLAGYAGEPLIGQQIPVHVNPDDPDDLTVRNEPQAVLTALTGAIIAALLAVLPLSAAVLARRRVLRTWRLGTARPAAALGRQQTALAPAARSVRCAWADAAGDRRVFAVYVPARSPEAAAGAEVVRVIAPPPGRGGRPLAAAWFE